jgi:lipoprotein NlpI
MFGRAFCVAVALVLAASAYGASPRDRHTCNESEDNDVAIAACTRVIDDRKESRRNRAEAYNSRGVAFKLQGDYKRALADYNAVLALEPANVNALINRAQLFGIMNDHDRAIQDADRILAKGGLNDRGKGIIYSVRGESWHAKGGYDRAIADFSASIKFRPLAETYRLRGRSWMGTAKFDRAIADYDETIRREPKDDFSYYARGAAHYFSGDVARASADLNRANELDPTDAYYVLWIDSIARRSDAPSRLAQVASGLALGEWPGPIVRLYLGQTTLAEVLAATDVSNPNRRRTRLCDAHFYNGQLLLKKDKQEAIRFLRLAANDCTPDDAELIYARLELRALGER